jgi:putative PEP-CTERM system TPR-repeat lipoprotein
MTTSRCSAAVAACLAVAALAACAPDDPTALMSSAREYLARADYPAASIQARNAVKAQPDSADARRLLGEALLRANDPVAAESEFRRALELGGARDDVLPLLAQAMLAAGRAEALVREFGGKPPADMAARAHFQASLGDAYSVLQRRDDAERAYREALAADGANANARLGLAQLDARAGRLDAATAATEAVIAADPKSAQAHALKSDILLSRRDRAGAKRALEQAVQADASYLPARYSLIATLIDEGAYDAARDQMTAVSKMAPGDVRLAYFESALALRTGDLATARDKVNQILKVAPDHVPSLVLVATIEVQSEQFASAEAHLRQALARAPNHEEARRLLAASYLRSGQSAKARQELQPLLAAREAPDSQVLLLAGEASMASGDMKQASAYYQQVAAKGEKTSAAAAHTRLGQIAMANGRPDDGMRELESAAEADPAFRQTDMALVSTFLRSGEIDKALGAARALEKKNPKDPMSHQVLGMVHMARQDTASARASFDRALELNPALVPAARALAALDVAEKKTDVARRRYEAMIAKDPRNATLHLALAELQLRTGAKPAEVVPTLRQAVAADPSSVDARLALISALARSGDMRSALSAAQEATAAHPDRAPLLQMLAMLQAEAGEPQQALGTLRKLTQLQPGVAGPLQRVAGVQVRQKQYDQAADTLRLAKETAPDDLSVSRDLIVLQLTAGRPEEALKEARAVQASSPRNAAGWLLESQVHETQRKFDEAEKALRQGLKVAPDSGLLAARVNGALLAGGKAGEADTFIRKWLADHPKDTTARMHLGEREMASKNHKAAASHYQAVLAVDPNNVVALNNLAWISGQMNDPKALQYAERAVKLAPESAAVLDTMGTLLVGKGEAKRGVDYLGRALRIAPDRADIRLNYAKALLGAGQKVEARRELEALQSAPGEFTGKAEIVPLLKSL